VTPEVVDVSSAGEGQDAKQAATERLTFPPKIHRPRNVDSRKNASSPSMARGAPKMSPTNVL
jgi:hypothetical protein